jgi:hypothetical protein
MTRTLKNVGLREHKLKLILMCKLKSLLLYKLHAGNTAIKKDILEVRMSSETGVGTYCHEKSCSRFDIGHISV